MTEVSDKQKVVAPFVIAALIWAVLGAGACRYFSVNSAAFHSNLLWLAGLGSLCLIDLAALGKLVRGILALATNPNENRGMRLFQTFSWGAIKLVCLGIFALVVIKARPIPTAGLLAGAGTLLFVPLIGGLIWSQGALGVS